MTQPFKVINVDIYELYFDKPTYDPRQVNFLKTLAKYKVPPSGVRDRYGHIIITEGH